MNFDDQKLLSLLPALYRIRDTRLVPEDGLLTAAEKTELDGLEAAAPGTLDPEEQARLAYLRDKRFRGPLGSLLAVVSEQLSVVEENLAQLYDDQFIETCAEWAIPYIGDLIGYDKLRGEVPGVSSPRADVGHTLSFRRRKGTAVMLEQVARDVTGWAATAVESFKRLADTQYLNHPRPGVFYAPDLRDWEGLSRAGTAFDNLPHRVDVRRIALGRGRYNLPDIGIFLWRLFPFSLGDSPLVPDPAAPWRFWMSPLGNDIPLFHHPATEEPLRRLATPLDVPDPIGRRAMDAHLADYYGPSLALEAGGMGVSLASVRVCNLSDGSENWDNRPSGNLYAVDPALGRVVVPEDIAVPADLKATFHYGFSAEMGGGEYSRLESLAREAGAPMPLQVPTAYATIQDALNALPAAAGGVVEITGNGRYEEDLQIQVPDGATVEIRAADEFRPVLVLSKALVVQGGRDSTFKMNGLLVTGNQLSVPRVPDSSGANANLLSNLELSHCTLVPGWRLDSSGQARDPGQPSLFVQVPDVRVSIDHCILGAVRSNPSDEVVLTDSILDATSITRAAYQGTDALVTGPGGSLTMEGVTVIGKVFAQSFPLVSNSVFLSALAPVGETFAVPVLAARRQEGCIRYTYLPVDSRVPRRHECQPPLPGDEVPSACAGADLSAPSDLGPIFTTLHYGRPAYCQMSPLTADAIRRGADDGGEMGAFHLLYQPQRETNLKARLVEYLRAGLEAGIFYET